MNLSAETLIAIIGNFGFPILVAVYLLTRLESKLDALTEAIIELKNKK
ncbi:MULTISPECIES: YvrJ family protein [Bacillus subtilis group]|nr:MULTISPECIES: YvrJ family protein [Bacillus subtilis group]MBV5123698.1 YvrJ family protein [Bacillus halotolerans]MDG3075206.1 YvrJ family protein [Bacillus halotolerans]MDO3654577.1 YvrJ family protein [Bacillus subtilis]